MTHGFTKEYFAVKDYVTGGGPFLPLAGGSMSGAISMGSYAITAATTITSAAAASLQLRANTSQNLSLNTNTSQIRLLVKATGDIEFRKADGSTVSLLWDESDDRWEFSTSVDMVGNDIIGANEIQGYTGVSLFLRPATGQDLQLRDDVNTSRILVKATTGDIFLRNLAGTNTLIWDESDNQWEVKSLLAAELGLTVSGGNFISQNDTNLLGNTGFAGSTWLPFSDDNNYITHADGGFTVIRGKADGTHLTVSATTVNVHGNTVAEIADLNDDVANRIRFDANVTGDISLFKKNGTTVSLLWDESDDRWEMATPFYVNFDSSVALLSVQRGVGKSWTLDFGSSVANFTADAVTKWQTSSGAFTITDTRTDATQKNMRLSTYHYTTAEEPVAGLYVSSTSGDNNVLMGGGTSLMNAATKFEVFTAANTTTVTGTSRFSILGSGDIAFKDDAAATTLLWDESDDQWEFNTNVTVDQSSATGALPVITLDQADVDEDYFKFIGTSDTSVDRALVDAVNFPNIGTRYGYIKVNIQDDQTTNPIPDGDYYIPFYAAPTV